MSSDALVSPLDCPDSWQVVSLKSISRKIGSGATPTGGQAAYQPTRSNFALVRSQNVFDREFSDNGLAFISDEQAKALKGVWLEPSDILINITGDGVTFGRACMVPTRVLPACVNQHVAIIRLDSGAACSGYVVSYLTHPVIKSYIESFNAGGSRRAITKAHIESFVIPLPPMATQVAISELLAAFDDRITLLRETNATLEAIAQALFKSWFVDFDPVRSKMEGRSPEGMDEATAALFPSSFDSDAVESIPSGWTRSSLGKFCSVTIGGLWGKDDQEETDLVPAISLRGVDLEHLRSNGFAPDAPIRWVKASAMEKRRLSGSQVLIASSGAGPCGRTLWAGGPLEKMYGIPVIFSNFVKRLECGSDVRALYVDRLLAEMRETREIWNFINGTSIPNLDDKLLLATKQVVMPPDVILGAFANVLKSIYCKLYAGQIETLVSLRDTLLPRLISGQLRLPEAHAQLKAAA